MNINERGEAKDGSGYECWNGLLIIGENNGSKGRIKFDNGFALRGTDSEMENLYSPSKPSRGRFYLHIKVHNMQSCTHRSHPCKEEMRDKKLEFRTFEVTSAPHNSLLETDMGKRK